MGRGLNSKIAKQGSQGRRNEIRLTSILVGICTKGSAASEPSGTVADTCMMSHDRRVANGYQHATDTDAPGATADTTRGACAAA